MPPKKRKINKRSAVDISRSSQRRKDIIAECPYEIMCNVLCHLDLKTICLCMEVSVIWRNRISLVRDIWRKIENTPQHFWQDNQASRVLPFVSHHVEEISFESRPKNMVHFTDAMRKYKFSKLKTLKLLADATGHKDLTCLDRRIHQTVTRVGNTLRELHLATNHFSPLSVRAILMRCPNLTALRIKTARINNLREQLRTPHLSLISLEISGIALELISDSLRGLIRSLPNLQYLMISKTCLLVDLLPHILQDCPRLSVLSSQPFAYRHARNTILQPSENDDESQGLQSISIEYLDAIGPFMPVLRKCCSTLKHIYMSTSNNVLIEPGWHLLSSIEMPQLTELHVVDYTSSFNERITSVIRRLPNLRTVNLQNPYTCRTGEQILRLNEGLFGALLELNHISSFSLTRFDVRGPTFTRLMENCAASKCLSLLSIVRCIGLNPAVLRLAASMQNMEVLNLAYSMDSINKADIDKFAGMIGSLPRLHHLILTQGMISDMSVLSINKSKSLRTLYVEGVEISRNGRKLLRPLIKTSKDQLCQEFQWVINL